MITKSRDVIAQKFKNKLLTLSCSGNTSVL